MPLAAGSHLGPYEILNLLGAGGMGEVYCAHDGRLDRKVAIKVLRADSATDTDRKLRFVQEAKAASALNHPNIVTIYDIASDSGIGFIVMEYVPGQALKDRIDHKRLGVSEALRYAVQIADALVAAHAAGIIHRDLKPANIMVTPQGVVKVLDFGLAKLTQKVELSEGDVTRTMAAAPENTAPKTVAGLIVGTPAYMSPEQAEGRNVDARSDIFSFGAILYEMVTGRKAFSGVSQASILSAILRDEPTPARQIAPEVPYDVEKIIYRCLRKDSARRFQAMPDLKVALQEAQEEFESAAVAVLPPARRRRQWPVLAALLVAIGAGVTWRVSNLSSPATKAPRIVPFTSSAGREQDPAISPDGKQIAFSWNGDKGDNFDIYVKRVDSDTPLRLTHDPALERCPAWSPDGSHVAFVRFGKDGGVFAIPALGGPERRLTDTYKPSLNDRCLDWSPDGKFLALADSSPVKEDSERIYLLSLETGERKQLTTELLDDNSPAFSPDGSQIAFTRWISYYVSDLYVVPVTGGQPKRLTFDTRLNRGPVWMPDGQSIVFSSDRDGSPALWRIPASGGKPLKIADAPGRDLIPGLSRQSPGGAPLLAFSESFVDTNIWKTNAADGAQSRLIASTRDDVAPDFSPDCKRIVFASNRSGSWEIWIADSDGSNALQLTSFRGTFVGSPRWSPDGREIAFDARPDGNGDIFTISSQGGTPRRLTREASDDTVPSWSRDGRWIYFSSNRGGESQIWKMPAQGGTAAQITRKGGFVSQESPDGRLLFYSKPTAAGLSTHAIWSLPTTGGEEVQTVESAFNRFWMPDADGIYFARAGEFQDSILEFLPFASRQPVRVATLGKPLEEFLGGMAVCSDRRWILYSQADQENTDIMLLENFFK